MTEAQAEAVVRLQLGQLAALESDEILKEYTELRERDPRLRDAAFRRARTSCAVIRDDLETMAAKYGDDRKTEITDDGGRRRHGGPDRGRAERRHDHPRGLHQADAADAYRVQRRGGKGVQGGLREDDFIEHFFVASTHAYLLCFTNRGQLYWLKVYHIPQASRTSAGRSIANVLSLKPEEKITSIDPGARVRRGLSPADGHPQRAR